MKDWRSFPETNPDPDPELDPDPEKLLDDEENPELDDPDLLTPDPMRFPPMMLDPLTGETDEEDEDLMTVELVTSPTSTLT